MSGVLTFPVTAGALPTARVSAGRYEVRFAGSPDELDRLLRLRYQVFNLELGEGLAESAASGRDEDAFDRKFHHLLIEERATGEVVGTYRMQTPEMAVVGGLYSAGLFETESLAAAVAAQSVEIGRACVAKPHRNGRVLQALWRGLAAYLRWNGKTRLFGCCSLTSQDEGLGMAVHGQLIRGGFLHREVRVMPRPGVRCRATGAAGLRALGDPAVPALFRAYLDIGAKVLGPPAIDRDFKTIDWLVMLDVTDLPYFTYRRLFR